MEAWTVQPTLTKLTTLIGLTATAVASIAVLLYISIARDFLPGTVELTAALSVALIFGIVVLAPRTARREMLERLNNIPGDRIGYVAVGVALLALTALLAAFVKSFPWPAPLILVVLLMVFAFRRSDGE